MNIEKMMVKSLYDLSTVALKEYPEDPINRDKWLLGKFPAQPILVIDSVMWTKGCTEAIQEVQRGKNKKAIDEYYEKQIL